jgi:hypothetical protein
MESGAGVFMAQAAEVRAGFQLEQFHLEMALGANAHPVENLKHEGVDDLKSRNSLAGNAF